MRPAEVHSGEVSHVPPRLLIDLHEQNPFIQTLAALPRLADALLPAPPLALVPLQQRRVLLFANEWEVQYFEKQNPTFGLMAVSPVA